MNKYEEAAFFFHYWSKRYLELLKERPVSPSHALAVFERSQHWFQIVANEYLGEMSRLATHREPQGRC